MVGDIYRYTYQQIRAYLPVHLAAIASKDSFSNSCGVDCTDRHVCCLGLLGLGPNESESGGSAGSSDPETWCDCNESESGGSWRSEKSRAEDRTVIWSGEVGEYLGR